MVEVLDGLISLTVGMGALILMTVFLLAFMSWLADRYIRAKLRHELEAQIREEANRRRRITDEYQG